MLVLFRKAPTVKELLAFPRPFLLGLQWEAGQRVVKHWGYGGWGEVMRARELEGFDPIERVVQLPEGWVDQFNPPNRVVDVLAEAAADRAAALAGGVAAMARRVVAWWGQGRVRPRPQRRRRRQRQGGDGGEEEEKDEGGYKSLLEWADDSDEEDEGKEAEG